MMNDDIHLAMNDDIHLAVIKISPIFPVPLINENRDD